MPEVPVNPSMSQRTNMLMRHKSTTLVFGMILVCAGAIIAMPFVPAVRGLWIDAMHGRIDDTPTMMAVQVVPKMYNFANRIAITDEPMDAGQIEGLPMSLPVGGEYIWMNHYPSWLMTASPVAIIPTPSDEPRYIYLLSRWRGVETTTQYKIHRGEAPKRFVVERMELAPAAQAPSPKGQK